jgi:hypothetical protein
MNRLIIDDLTHLEDLSDECMSQVSGGTDKEANPVLSAISMPNLLNSCCAGRHFPPVVIRC